MSGRRGKAKPASTRAKEKQADKKDAPAKATRAGSKKKAEKDALEAAAGDSGDEEENIIVEYVS